MTFLILLYHFEVKNRRPNYYLLQKRFFIQNVSTKINPSVVLLRDLEYLALRCAAEQEIHFFLLPCMKHLLLIQHYFLLPDLTD